MIKTFRALFRPLNLLFNLIKKHIYSLTHWKTSLQPIKDILYKRATQRQTP